MQKNTFKASVKTVYKRITFKYYLSVTYIRGNVDRRKFLRTAGYVAGLAFLPSYSFAANGKRVDDGYTREERAAFDGLIETQRKRILELGETGRIPLQAMVTTIEPYENNIIARADQYDVPRHLALGIAVLENGGGPARSTRCCKGVMQLSKQVAKIYGAMKLEEREILDRKRRVLVDYRHIPVINISAGVRYLSDLYKVHFPDWGFSAQAYHAGPGRVKQGISKYLKATRGKSVDWRKIGPKSIKEEGIIWIKMMQNPAAFRFFEGLRDESEFYLPKALACWRIYRHRKGIFA